MRISLKPLIATGILSVGFLADYAAGAANTPSLYERMGGAEVVTAVSNQLIDRTVADPKLKRSFDKVDIPRLKKLLIEQICALSGGPCKYSGDTMKEVHAGLNIRQDEFYGMVEELRTVMIDNHIELRERNELLALLAPMKRDVVTR
ncbi:MAG: group 1 truncated hemoglobin [Steroidobacteraceae bacterium]